MILIYKLQRLFRTHVIDRLNPKNKWARALIPNNFADVDYIFEELLFSGLIFFWEEDDGETSLRYQWESGNTDFPSSPERIAVCHEVYDVLKAAYDWAKIRTEKYDSITMNWQEEQTYVDLDTLHLVNIAKYRKYMWT